MGAMTEVKREWKHFRDDPPGERFGKHRRRMQHRPRSHSLIASGVGVVLMGGGVVLLFMPGPGIPLIVFGLGLVASHSERLAALLDRTEPKLRRFGRHTVRRWKGLPGSAKVGMITAIAAVGAVALLVMWKFVVAGYLAG